jgi:polyhydroxybutyrate depolymerase
MMIAINMSRKTVMFIVLSLISLVVIFGLLVFGVFLSSADRNLLLGSASKLEHDGRQRTYRLFVPKKVADKPQLIIALHGLGGDSRQMTYFSALHNSSGKKAVVIYPDSTRSNQPGIRPGWNAGFCCGSGYKNNVDDVGFISALIDKMIQDYSVDTQKIYAVGFSNGGMFAQRLATELPDKISGFASVAGSIGTRSKKLEPNSPVPALHIHGEMDRTVQFGGGPGKSDKNFVWLSFEQTIKAWEKANNCSEPVKLQAGEITTTNYKQCAAPLKTITYAHNAHKWPDWRLLNIWHKKTAGSAQAVEFFNSLTVK